MQSRKGRLSGFQLIRSEGRNYMHKHVDKKPVSGVFEHEFVFEIIENSLDERAFTQKDFLFERHQNIFHRALYSRDYFQSSNHQTKKQILADVAFVRKSFHVCCHLRHYRPIIHIAFREFRVHCSCKSFLDGIHSAKSNLCMLFCFFSSKYSKITASRSTIFEVSAQRTSHNSAFSEILAYIAANMTCKNT